MTLIVPVGLSVRCWVDDGELMMSMPVANAGWLKFPVWLRIDLAKGISG